MIKGSVELQTAVKLVKVDIQTVEKRFKQINWHLTPDALGLQKMITDFQDFSTPSVVDEVWVNDCVVIEQAGIFGESVLIEPKERESTAVCIEEQTELLCISNKIYKETIEKSIRRDLDKRIAFLRGVSVFQEKSTN